MTCFCCQALDSKNNCVHGAHELATRWTLFGALAKCYPGHQLLKVFKLCRESLGVHSLEEWNNDPTTTFDKISYLLATLDL